MVRTQIQLTKTQADGLKELAAAEGRSMADLVRTSVDALLERAGHVSRSELRKRALAAVGRYKGGPRDLAVHHDRYLETSARR